jgi:ketosteroid isomerase-like protein
MSAPLAILAALAAQPGSAPAGCPVDRLRGASLEQTQAAWLQRFNALDLPCFLRFFAPDATLFSPSPQDGTARRVEPSGIADYWTKMFARLGEGGRKLSIVPQSVAITTLGAKAAVVSFHLSSDSYPNRRTLVWRRDQAGWRIVHLHASRIAPPPAR